MHHAANEALEKLLQGNRRFVADANSRARRKELAEVQQPFAVVLACSDSRVAVEKIFDLGLGDAFVVRVAGNVVSAETLASVEYGVAVLSAPLVLVLGHSSCGAVTAALERVRDASLTFPGAIPSLVERILSAITSVDRHGDEALAQAVELNVRAAAKELEASSTLAQAVRDKRAMIRGAVYDLASGSVRLLE